MAVPLRWTEYGFETQFGINHLGHHALSTALVPALKQAAPARVVCALDPRQLPSQRLLPPLRPRPRPRVTAVGPRPSNWRKGRPHAREAVLTDGVRALARASGGVRRHLRDETEQSP
jgi:hypothetical protein